MIPVVRWIRNGYAAELPVRIEPPEGDEPDADESDPMNLERYDEEDSRPNQRPPSLRV